MATFRKHRLIIIAIAAYMVIFGIVGVYRHYNFQTQTWDMGVFDQLFWNTINGRVMQSSIEEIPNHFGIHWSPGLLLLVPGYAVFPSPYFLIIIQVLALALGAWPLYKLALRVLKQELPAKLIAVAYLLYPALHWVNLFDFHEIAFFVPLMLAGMYFMESKQFVLGFSALFLAANMKEDAIIAVAFYLLYIFVRKTPGTPQWWTRERKFALAAFIGFAVYFILVIKVFMPAFGGGLLRLDRYANLGNSFGDIAKNIITKPQLLIATVATLPKFMYVFWLLIPVIGLPLFSGSAFLLLVPGLLENLLTAYQSQFTGFYQYDALLIPGIFFAAIIGAGNMMRRKPGYSKILHGALIAGMLVGFFTRSPLNPFTFPFNLFGTNERWEVYRGMLNDTQMPPDASVTAQTNLLPHLSRREKIYQLGMEHVFADAAFIDTGDQFGFEGNTDAFGAYITQYTKNDAYQTTVYNDRYLVVKKKI